MCWDKNKIHLEGASTPASPSKGPWPMSTCGPTSFQQVQSKVCQSLAFKGRGTCTSGPTSFMASKEKPQLLFRPLVIRWVLGDDYSTALGTQFQKFQQFQKMAILSKTYSNCKANIATVKFNVKHKVRETSHEHKCKRIRIKLIFIENVCSSVKICPQRRFLIDSNSIHLKVIPTCSN